MKLIVKNILSNEVKYYNGSFDDVENKLRLDFPELTMTIPEGEISMVVKEIGRVPVLTVETDVELPPEGLPRPLAGVDRGYEHDPWPREGDESTRDRINRDSGYTDGEADGKFDFPPEK